MVVQPSVTTGSPPAPRPARAPHPVPAADRPPLVIGFDLDMTLIDTVPGFAATLRSLGAELEVELPIEQMTSRLGPPLDLLLAGHLPAEAIPGAVQRFRAIYPELAVGSIPALPGATEALAAVRGHGAGILVVTGKYRPNAQRHLDHLALDVDTLVGELWGSGKAAALLEHGAEVYVGDHVHDVEGALAAGAVSVSLLTGGCSREELLAAGTHVVLEDLAAFPGWLAGYVELRERLHDLADDLTERGSLLVAFSGGADSAFLLAAATRVLGTENVAAATADSASLPRAEHEAAQRLAARLGVRALSPRTDEMGREGYRANDGDRCYFCKAELLDTLGPLADAHGLAHVATGTNADDAVAGFRPGIRAAAERGAVTPLLDAGLTKAQIREASRLWGLPTWDKPAAACLSSRVAFGVEVTPHRLARVERAELTVRRCLAELGTTSEQLRVRDLGDVGRVELDPAVVERLTAEPPARQAVLDAVRGAGFAEAEIDPRGFRSGSMNELLPDPERFR